jgi:hypothetical protein
MLKAGEIGKLYKFFRWVLYKDKREKIRGDGGDHFDEAPSDEIHFKFNPTPRHRHRYF